MDAERRPQRHASYLLRLRWVEQAGRLTCQARLQSVSTREIQYFADLNDMATFLQDEAWQRLEPDPRTWTSESGQAKP